MTNLSLANQELYRRTPDECFESLESLAVHCQGQKERAQDCWKAPLELDLVAVPGSSLSVQIGTNGEYLAGATLDDCYELVSWAELFKPKAPRFALWLNNLSVSELERRDAEDFTQPPDHELLDFTGWKSTELGQALLAADAICTVAKNYGAGQMIERIKTQLNGVVMLRLQEADELLLLVQRIAPRPE